MESNDLVLPAFRADGYLPEGLHLSTEAEVTFRFGSSNRRRRTLIHRVRRWIELARSVGAPRLIIDGSFVTSKEEPNDIDAIIRLPGEFMNQIDRGVESALELENMLLTRHPEEIFAAEDDADWNDWIEF